MNAFWHHNSILEMLNPNKNKIFLILNFENLGGKIEKIITWKSSQGVRWLRGSVVRYIAYSVVDNAEKVLTPFASSLSLFHS